MSLWGWVNFENYTLRFKWRMQIQLKHFLIELVTDKSLDLYNRQCEEKNDMQADWLSYVNTRILLANQF